jgi:hypothetical protein
MVFAGGKVMSKKTNNRKKVLKRLAQIAFGRCNDAVRLSFIKDGSDDGGIDGLDLTMLSEIKRSSSGAVEVKMLNRLEAIRMLLEKLEEDGKCSETGSGLIEAITMAAEANSCEDKKDL